MKGAKGALPSSTVSLNTITCNNNKFKSVEQGFQYSKAMLFGDDRRTSLTLLVYFKSPSESKCQHAKMIDAERWNQERNNLKKDSACKVFTK